MMGALRLPLGESRCMDCDGELAPVALAEVAHEVPRRAKGVCSEFFRCRGCGKLYWHGTSWERIKDRLGRAAELARGGPISSEGPTG